MREASAVELGDSRESTNVEDVRGSSGGGMGRGRGPIAIGGAGGIGVLLLALVAMYFGVDPSVILGGGGGGVGPTTDAPSRSAPARSQSSPQAQQSEHFVKQILATTEDTWQQIFREGGKQYPNPKLVLFSGGVQSACGMAQSATGPFYCPGDEKLYLDLSFFDELAQRFGAPGDFAQAYVIAHEVGHHVQKQLGITDKVDQYRQQGGGEANRASVMLELQADCFAGVWANRTEARQHVLQAGDIDEGLRAAAAVGDDRIQKETRGRVVPDSFTHGSSEQRVRWFRRGFESGKVDSCNTFKAGSSL
jgi:predicted metalloprotease